MLSELDTKQVTISRNVIFKEHIFPFKDPKPTDNTTPQPDLTHMFYDTNLSHGSLLSNLPTQDISGVQVDESSHQSIPDVSGVHVNENNSTFSDIYVHDNHSNDIVTSAYMFIIMILLSYMCMILILLIQVYLLDILLD